MNQRELKKAIYAKKQSLTDEELFLGRPYKRFIQKMIQGVTKQFHVSFGVNVFKDCKDGATIACTDKDTVYINGWNDFCKEGNPRSMRNEVILGLCLHECGHILFTNFALNNKAFQALQDKNELYPAPDKNFQNDLFTDWLKEGDGQGKHVLPLYKILCNCIEDGYIEKALLPLFPGYGKSLDYVRQLHRSTISAYTGKDAEDNKIGNVVNLVLAQAKFGDAEYKTAGRDEVTEAFEKIHPLVDDAVTERSSYHRQKKINEIMCILFAMIKEQLEKPKDPSDDNQDSSGDDASASGDGQFTGNEQDPEISNNEVQSQEKADQGDASEQEQESEKALGNDSGSQQEAGDSSTQNTQQLQELLNQLAQQNQGMSDFADHSNASMNSPALDQSNTGSLEAEETSESQENQLASSGKSLLDLMSEQTAEESVFAQNEQNIERELQKAVNEVPLEANIHKGVNTNIHRATPNEGKYDELHGELDSIARRMMKNLLKEVKDRQLGDAMDGFYIGNRLNTSQLYRKDKKLMIRDVLPEEVPNMEICILVDESGSMSGDRIVTATKCAYITYAFCKMLGIPVSVFGHHTYGTHNVVMESYADSESLDGMDKMRLFSMSATGCNRDGFALRYCLNRLRKSHAQDRFMMIISDGLPNDGDYRVTNAKPDMQDAVACARKEGINVITAGIGDDAEQVKYVYTNGVSEKRRALFLDIGDLERLPKTFVKIVKKALEAA